MRSKYMLTRIVIIAVFLFLLYPVIAHASEISDLGAQTLINTGVLEYNRGNVDAAAHEFKKALMVSPDNEKAKEWLRSLGIEPGEYAVENMYVTNNVSAQKQVTLYEQQLHDLAMQNIIQQDSIYRLEAEKKELLQENFSEGEQLYKVRLEDSALFSKGQRANGKGQRAEGKGQTITSSHCALRSMPENKIPSHISDNRTLTEKYDNAVDLAYQYEKELAELDEKYTHTRDRAVYQYKHQDKLIHVLEDYLHLREAELNTAKDEVVFRELSLAKSIQRLLTKLDELIELQESIGQYSSNAVDVDNAQEKKLTEIRSLKSELNDVYSKLALRNMDSEEKISQLDNLKERVFSVEEKLAMMER